MEASIIFLTVLLPLVQLYYYYRENSEEPCTFRIDTEAKDGLRFEGFNYHASNPQKTR